MKVILPIVLFLQSLLSLAQGDMIELKKIGFPFIRNFNDTEYQNHNQNWAAVQDSLDILYIGNQGGLLLFDGSNWESYTLENREGIKSLTKDNLGQIYYGTNGDFGYLTADSIGSIKINSLKKLLSQQKIQIGTISNCIAINNRIFFQSREALYVYDRTKNEIEIFEDDNFRQPTRVGDALYVLSNDELFRFIDNQLQKLETSKIKFIATIDNQLFINYKNNSVMLFDGDSFTKSSISTKHFPDNIRFLRQYENYLVIGTKSEGIHILDRNGSPILNLNEDNGLTTSSINDSYLDHFKNLWLMHDFGLSKIEWNSAYSLIDDRNEIKGSAIITEKYNDELYVGTYSGLYKATWPTSSLDSFKKLNEGNSSYWYLLKDENSVVAGTGNGVLSFDQKTQKSLFSDDQVVYSMAFTEDKKNILVGTKYDFFVLKKVINGWGLHKRIENFHQLSDFILPIKNRTFWMSNSGSGLFKLSLNESMDSIIYQLYDESDGLPSIYNNRIFQHKDKVKFTTEDGVYDYLASKDLFMKDTVLSSLMKNEFVYRFEESSNGQIWFVHRGERGVLYPTSQGYDKVYLPSKKLDKFNNENINPIDNENVLIATNYGLLHIDPSKPLINGTSFQSIITKVTNISNDSIIATTHFNQSKKFIFPSTIHSLKFDFSATSFDDFEKNEFQWRLVGYESAWSSSKMEKRKDFTNLNYGEYTFEVRAINVYNTASSVSKFRFTILPPWYFTWWAFASYGLLFLLILIVTALLNSRRLKKENERLEGLVTERTKEISSQKETIEKALIERESLLKEIHHRVKNNLQIIASLLYLQSGKFEDEDFKRVLEEGQGRVRSMALIHQKLYENEDLKSIPFGEYLQELVSEIRASFGMGNIQLNIEADNIFFDVDTAVPLGLIVNEMATNAFKYAYEDNGKGSLSIFITEENGEYTLNVKDDGKGIPDEIDIRKTKSLGLRLVRMLSQQLEGEFEFESTNGTSFQLKFAA